MLDLDPALLAEFEALGAVSATSRCQLAEQSDIICSAVVNDRQTLDVIQGGDGVLAGATAGALIILHSTISVATCEEVSWAADAKGVSVIDAAVSGAAERSELGTPSLMIGGDPPSVERAMPPDRTGWLRGDLPHG